MLDPPDDPVLVELDRIKHDGQLLAGEVHIRQVNAGQLAHIAFDCRCAVGARHACDGKRDVL
jgi:hypothetical protein